MNRSDITKALTDLIYEKVGGDSNYTAREVSIIDKRYKNYGRVDFVVYDNLDIWRFYEIKSCKNDFYSDAKWTFVGNYNYFVLPSGLYEEVKDSVPSYVGVYEADKNFRFIKSIKRAKRQKIGVQEDVLLDRFIVSLSRDADKYINTQGNIMEKRNKDLKNEISRLNNKVREVRRQEVYLAKKNIIMLNLLKQSGWKRKDIRLKIDSHLDKSEETQKGEYKINEECVGDINKAIELLEGIEDNIIDEWYKADYYDAIDLLYKYIKKVNKR